MRTPLSQLHIAYDLAGCPCRCRHCWLGVHENCKQCVDAFEKLADTFISWRKDISNQPLTLSFSSWWREPDYHKSYKILWELEQKLSCPGCAKRSELLSVWRAARDPEYIPWLATLPIRDYQLSFFGLEENTDWFVQRKGAFQDNLDVSRRLIDHGLVPRWQLFITKRCLNDLDGFLRLMDDLRLADQCREIGAEFSFFIGGISPEGNGLNIEELRLEQDDLPYIPSSMVERSRDGLNLLGAPEGELYAQLAARREPSQQAANYLSLNVTVSKDVYPNTASPAPWWRLGNLEKLGVQGIIENYETCKAPGQWANENLPVIDLAKQFGRPDGKRLYHPDDLLTLWLNRWGKQWMQQHPA